MSNIHFLSSATTSAILCWAAEAVFVAGILALVAQLLTRIRGLTPGPAARHALWLTVLFKLITPPVTHWPWSYAIDGTSIAVAAPASDEPSEARTTLSTRSRRSEATARSITPTRKRPETTVSVRDVVEGPSELSAAVAIEAAVHNAPREQWPSTVTASSESVAAASPLPDVPVPVRSLLEQSLHWLLAAWMLGSLGYALFQARRIVRFCRQRDASESAPVWLRREADRVAQLLDVRPPEIQVTSGTGTPRLWCLGRPVLLIPRELLTTMTVEGWRGVLAHELAHLRRGDHWVCRLELLASLVWWWNPLFWLTVRRLDAEAELACDACVISRLPEVRLPYAQALVEICEHLSFAHAPAPSLGVASAGRFLERRLTMILNERVPDRLAGPAFLLSGLLALVALPGWLVAAPPATAQGEPLGLARVLAGAIPADSPLAVEAEEEEEDDDDDDDDVETAIERQVERLIERVLGPDFEDRMEAWGERIAREMEGTFGPGSDFERALESLGKEFEETFGDDFARRMEEFGTQFEQKFGPELERQVEALAADFEKNLGPALQQKMEAFGREFEKAFGPEFQKKMEGLGKELETEIGPEIEKRLKILGEELSKQYGPGSEFEQRARKLGEQVQGQAKELSSEASANDEVRAARKAAAEAMAKAREAEAKARDIEARVEREAAARAREAAAKAREADEARKRADEEKARAKATSQTETRTARIQVLEARMKEIAAELERLKKEVADEGK